MWVVASGDTLELDRARYNLLLLEDRKRHLAVRHCGFESVVRLCEN